MRRFVVLLAVSGLCVGLLAACSTDEEGGWSLPVTGPADVEVDTPALRAAKAEAGIDDCPSPEDDGPVGAGELPEITLECFGGGSAVDLSELRGPLVISVWGQWCIPCREEMPVLEEYYQQHGDRVPLLGIDFQDPQSDEVMEFLGETGATYPQLADPGGAIDGAEPFPRLQGIPFLMFVDAEGRVAHRQFVVIEEPGELRGLVSEHLGVDL